uniref:Uncharacterized protein n=1 Tax=Avena sativa TaxID=4498 RepID=A0ACD6A875_AVESA
MDSMTLLGSLDEATTYITKLKDRVDELHKRRSSVQAIAGLGGGAGTGTGISTRMSGGTGLESDGEKPGKELAEPIVDVRHHDDCSMDVILICSVRRPIKLHKVITILKEEGAEIVNANHSVTGNKIFYNLHSRVLITCALPYVYHILHPLLKVHAIIHIFLLFYYHFYC